MDHARPGEERIGFVRDAHGRRRVRRWYAADARMLAVAFVVTVVLVVVASALLEWAAAL